MNRETAVATYFTKLKLTNFRRFGDVELDLCDERGNVAQWTLLLGDNASGKTTLLQALAWIRPVPVMDESGEEEGESEEEFDEEYIEDAGSSDDFFDAIKEGEIGCALTVEDNFTIEKLYRIGAEKDHLSLRCELMQGGELGSPQISIPGRSETVVTNITFYFEGNILRDESKGKNPEEDKQVIGQHI